MKLTLAIMAAIGLSSCANMDAWLVEKTGVDSLGWLSLGISGKAKVEDLKAEYDAVKINQTSAK